MLYDGSKAAWSEVKYLWCALISKMVWLVLALLSSRGESDGTEPMVELCLFKYAMPAFEISDRAMSLRWWCWTVAVSAKIGLSCSRAPSNDYGAGIG